MNTAPEDSFPIFFTTVDCVPGIESGEACIPKPRPFFLRVVSTTVMSDVQCDLGRARGSSTSSPPFPLVYPRARQSLTASHLRRRRGCTSYLDEGDPVSVKFRQLVHHLIAGEMKQERYTSCNQQWWHPFSLREEQALSSGVSSSLPLRARSVSGAGKAPTHR